MSTDSAGYQHTDAYLGAGVAYSASHGVWGWHSAEKCVRLEKKKRKKEGLFLTLAQASRQPWPCELLTRLGV